MTRRRRWHDLKLHTQRKEDILGAGRPERAVCAAPRREQPGGVSSPVAGAVPATGYLSEDTDGGGSIREVELEYAETEDGPPSYTHDGRWTGRHASPRPLIV
jgi:hypothetical protein